MPSKEYLANWPKMNCERLGARRALVPDPTGSRPIGRVSEISIFRSEGPKKFSKALSHSIFHANRKYDLEFVIRLRKDREKLKLQFYRYRIG